MDGIIDPVAKQRILAENAEQVYFQDLKKQIIQKIAAEWKSKRKVHEKIENKYYNLEYTIEDCYNQTGNRTLVFHRTGKKIHDYNHIDISNIIRNILSI